MIRSRDSANTESAPINFCSLSPVSVRIYAERLFAADATDLDALLRVSENFTARQTS